jgi:hypothetical protein
MEWQESPGIQDGKRMSNVLWHMMSHNLVDRYQRFGETCCLKLHLSYHEHTRRWRKFLRDVDTHLSNYRLKIPEDLNLNTYGSKNLKFHLHKCFTLVLSCISRKSRTQSYAATRILEPTNKFLAFRECAIRSDSLDVDNRILRDECRPP